MGAAGGAGGPLAQASEEDQVFIKKTLGAGSGAGANSDGAASVIDSKLLRALLGAYDYIGISPIRELPLELAILDICGEKEQSLLL